MSLIVWLQTLRTVAFVTLALLAFALWRRQRSRSALLLLGVFGLLATVLVLSRVSPTVGGVLGKSGRDVTVLALLWVPWLLAAFAWSFEGRLPRWLRLASVPLVAISIWKLVLPALPAPGQPRVGIFVWFYATFIGMWTILMLIACYRLWRAGGQQLLVRSRMRTMAVGALTLNLALLAAGWVRPERDSRAYLAILALSLVAGVLFLTGFAPPEFLRNWWRRRAYAGWPQMQTDLIAAATPHQVAEAVVPMLTEVVGGAVAVFSRRGPALAHRGFGVAALDRMRLRIEAGDLPTDHDHVFIADNCWLVLQPSAHSPLFGSHEVALIEGFTLHLRLALERAELYEANLRSKAELERSSQETESMLVGLGHDLRSPAMTIAGYTDLLAVDPDAPDRNSLLTGLSESARYLSRLVDSLLELCSVGREGLTTQEVDLDAVVRSVSGRLTAAHPGLKVAVPRPLPHVVGIPLRLEQLFDNLMTNAVKHGGRDPITVAITWDESPTGVRLTFSDDGRGIPDVDREAVFAPFRRGRNATTDGNGVGLGLIRRIVEAVGGTIRLAEPEAGAAGGASFEIDLLSAPNLAPTETVTT